MEPAPYAGMAQEPDYVPAHEDRRNGRAWGILLTLVVAFGIGVLIYPELVDRAPTANRDSGSSSSGTAPIGTTGRDEVPGSGANAGPAATPGIIREIETITSLNDAHELIGRRVELHVPVRQHINDVAFWVGSGDHRILVVLGRDDRDSAERQRGLPSSTSLQDGEGAPVTVTGTIQGLPHAEAMSSWGLTNADREALLERRIYIRAEEAR